MKQFKWGRALVPLAGVALAISLAVGSAGAGEGDAPRKATIVAKGAASTFKPNRFIGSTMRFAPDVTDIRGGGKLTLVNKTREPHTLSIVGRKQVPDTLKEVNRCNDEGNVCHDFFVAHEVSDEGVPAVPVVNKGAPGLDRAGDSIVFEERESIRVSADRGKTLNFICAIHPWMQGKIRSR